MRKKWPLVAAGAGLAAAAAVVTIREFRRLAGEFEDLRGVPDGPHR